MRPRTTFIRSATAASDSCGRSWRRSRRSSSAAASPIGIAIRELTHGGGTKHRSPPGSCSASPSSATACRGAEPAAGAKEAEERGWKRLVSTCSESSDPTVRAVVVEDSAALIGLVLAALGLLLSHHLGSGRPGRDRIAAHRTADGGDRVRPRPSARRLPGRQIAAAGSCSKRSAPSSTGSMQSRRSSRCRPSTSDPRK